MLKSRTQHHSRLSASINVQFLLACSVCNTSIFEVLLDLHYSHSIIFMLYSSNSLQNTHENMLLMSHFESDKNEKELKFKHTVITYHLFPASCHAQCQCFSNWVVSDNVVMTMQSHLATGHHHNWIYIQGTEKKKSHEKTWIFVFVEISKKKKK